MIFPINAKYLGFSKNAQILVEHAKKSPYLRNFSYDNNIIIEFSRQKDKIIEMILEPDGSYKLKTYTKKLTDNARCSELINTKNGSIMIDILKMVEKKIGAKSSDKDVLTSRDFTQDMFGIKAYERTKGGKRWHPVSMPFDF